MQVADDGIALVNFVICFLTFYTYHSLSYMMIEVVKMLYFRLCVTVEYACVQFSELNATETKRPKAH